jgi:hypothetical protein
MSTDMLQKLNAKPNEGHNLFDGSLSVGSDSELGKLPSPTRTPGRPAGAGGHSDVRHWQAQVTVGWRSDFKLNFKLLSPARA